MLCTLVLEVESDARTLWHLYDEIASPRVRKWHVAHEIYENVKSYIFLRTQLLATCCGTEIITEVSESAFDVLVHLDLATLRQRRARSMKGSEGTYLFPDEHRNVNEHLHRCQAVAGARHGWTISEPTGTANERIAQN